MPMFGGLQNVLAMSGFQSGCTVAMLALILVGALLLFMGLKLVRLVFTLAFVVIGALAGLSLAEVLAGRVSVPYLSWICPVGGAVIVGLLGFLFHRIWVILVFGFAMAWAAAVGFLTVSGGDAVRELHRQSWTQAVKFSHAFLHGDFKVDNDKSEARLTTEQLMSLKPDQPWNVEAYSREVKAHALRMGVAATVGLVIGLLIAGMLFRFATVILTTLWGVKWVLAGIMGLLLLHNPKSVDSLQHIGWKTMLGPAGLWLLGIWAQGMLARKKAPAPAAPPANK